MTLDAAEGDRTSVARVAGRVLSSDCVLAIERAGAAAAANDMGGGCCGEKEMRVVNEIETSRRTGHAPEPVSGGREEGAGHWEGRNTLVRLTWRPTGTRESRARAEEQWTNPKEKKTGSALRDFSHARAGRIAVRTRVRVPPARALRGDKRARLLVGIRPQWCTDEGSSDRAADTSLRCRSRCAHPAPLDSSVVPSQRNSTPRP